MNKIIKNRFSAYLLAILCMFLWGSAFPTIKTTYKILNIGANDYFSMIYVAGLRFFLAGLIVLILMSFFDRKNMVQLKTNFLFLLKIGLIVISFGYLFFYIGTGNTSG
ncbi:EamA family transporter, partial [Helcococcus bovis]